MMQPGKWTEDELLMLTEGRVKDLHYFGVLNDDDVDKWYDTTESLDAYLSKFTYFDSPW